MSGVSSPSRFDGFVESIACDQVALRLLDGEEEIRVVMPIAAIPEGERAFLSPGAICHLVLGNGPVDLRFSRETLSREDLLRARREAANLLAGIVFSNDPGQD